MKLPDLMIVPIFNKFTDIQLDRGSFDMDAEEEEEKRKQSQRLTRMDNLLPHIKKKVVDLDMEVESFKQ